MAIRGSMMNIYVIASEFAKLSSSKKYDIKNMAPVCDKLLSTHYKILEQREAECQDGKFLLSIICDINGDNTRLLTRRNDYLNVDQAAHYVNTTPMTLRYYKIKRIGPKWTKNRNRICYKKTELDHWLESKKKRVNDEKI